MAQTARVSVTLSNIATEEDLHTMEERIMSALSDAITQLRTTVENLTLAGRPERVAELEAAVQAERDANAALVAKAAEVASVEELEDVEQQRLLDEAKAATDALVAEMTGAATDLTTITEQLNAVGTAVDDTPDETPVGEVEVPEPVPAEPAPVDANPTVDPSSPTTTDGTATDAGTATDVAAPTGGPVDASGNPVEAPRV